MNIDTFIINMCTGYKTGAEIRALFPEYADYHKLNDEQVYLCR